MTNQQILTKAIEMAMLKGWEFDNLDKWEWHAIKKTDTVMTNWYYFLITYDGKEKFIDAERIIYDHDFAKSLWGNNATRLGIVKANREIIDDIDMMPLWEKHLMQMVIADDPIAYLGANI